MHAQTHSSGSPEHDAPLRAGGLPPLVRAFVERLRHVPLGVWAALADEHEPPESGETGETGERDGVADWTPERESGPRARLRQLVDETPGHAALVRRRVLELTAAAEGFVRPATVRKMKKAALTAALALSVRPTLAAGDFEQLYAPFAALLPLAELEAELGRNSTAHDGVLAG